MTRRTLRARARSRIKRHLAKGPIGRLARVAAEIHPYFYGRHADACEIHPTAEITNTTLNASSGVIRIHEWVMCAHGVRLLTGTHDATRTGQARHSAVPPEGRDITIERGAWVASGATVIGPAVIGENSIVCAGSVVIGDVPANTMVAGIPAKIVKRIVPID